MTVNKMLRMIFLKGMGNEKLISGSFLQVGGDQWKDPSSQFMESGLGLGLVIYVGIRLLG